MALFLLICRSCAAYHSSVSLSEIAFGICSGKTVIGKRVPAIARTWLQLIPEVHIYTDNITNSELRLILSQSNHLNIKFHVLPAPSHVLIGSRNDDAWNAAQDRYFAAIRDLFLREPAKKFYFFCDDDTYIYPQNIPIYLHDKNPDDSSIFGRLYQPWIQAVPLYRSPNDDTVLAQGGAGFFVSSGLREELLPLLDKCQEVFVTGNLPSSNRLSLCLERYLGSERAVNLGIYHHAEWILNEDLPDASRPRWSPLVPLISYHHVLSPLCEELWHAHVTTRNGSVWDWTHITLASAIVEIGEQGRAMELVWGSRIYFHATKYGNLSVASKNDQYRRASNFSRAIGPPTPLFDGGNIVAFAQKFDGGISLQYECDERLPPGRIEADRFLHGEEYGNVFRVRCPEPSTFPISNAKGESPLSITVEAADSF
jgi:hypothetical protein